MEIKHLPRHARYTDGTELTGGVPDYSLNSKYSYGLHLPHFLNYFSNDTVVEDLPEGNNCRAIIASTTELKTGDEITNECGLKAIVVKVTERRKAKGDWSKNPFDTNPDFVAFSYI